MNNPDINNLLQRLHFDRPWSLQNGLQHDDPLQRVLFDEKLLAQVSSGVLGPCLSIGRGGRCLVATVRESRMDRFAEASQALYAEGWPVLTRCTGGSCVPQGPGVLNLSIVHPRIKGWTLEDGYQLLCLLLSRLLASYGLLATSGDVPGSFCDGRYNLQVGQQKLAGTAQRWAGGSRDQAAVLAHACLLVDLDLFEATEKINTLYELCGQPRRFLPKACATLRECLGGDQSLSQADFMAEVEARLTALVRDFFQIGN